MKKRFSSPARIMATLRAIFREIRKHPVVAGLALILSLFVGVGTFAEAALNLDELRQKFFPEELSAATDQISDPYSVVTEGRFDAAPGLEANSVETIESCLRVVTKIYNIDLKGSHIESFHYFDFDRDGNRDEMLIVFADYNIGFNLPTKVAILDGIGNQPRELISFTKNSAGGSVIEYQKAEYPVIWYSEGNGPGTLRYFVYEMNKQGSVSVSYENVHRGAHPLILNKRFFVKGDGTRFELLHDGNGFSLSEYVSSFSYPALGHKNRILKVRSLGPQTLQVELDGHLLTFEEEGPHFRIVEPIRAYPDETLIIDERLSYELGGSNFMIYWKGLTEVEGPEKLFTTLSFGQAEECTLTLSFDGPSDYTLDFTVRQL